MHLQGQVELKAFAGGLEEQGMTESVASHSHRMTAGDLLLEMLKCFSKLIRGWVLEAQARPIGADGFNADRASLARLAQRMPGESKPLRGIAGMGDQALRERLQADHLSLRELEGVLLLSDRKGVGGGEPGVDQHRAGRGSSQQLPRVCLRIQRVSV